MKIRRWPLGAGLGVFLAAAAVAGAGAGRPGSHVMFVGSGAAALLGGTVALAWHARPRDEQTEPATSNTRRHSTPGRPRTPRTQTDLESVVAEFAGPVLTAHALRCVALVDMLRDQLVLGAEEAEHLAMAAALHVLPAAFPATEDSHPGSCEFEAHAMHAAMAKLRRLAPEEAVRMASEVCERWDGQGLPGRLAGEQCSLGGRILAAVCRFDHASAEGLEAGLQTIRDGSGTAFDPVVVAELVHLFKQPWQQRVAA